MCLVLDIVSDDHQENTLFAPVRSNNFVTLTPIKVSIFFPPAKLSLAISASHAHTRRTTLFLCHYMVCAGLEGLRRFTYLSVPSIVAELFKPGRRMRQLGMFELVTACMPLFLMGVGKANLFPPAPSIIEAIRQLSRALSRASPTTMGTPRALLISRAARVHFQKHIFRVRVTRFKFAW
jgi:hypothetical protein